LVDIPTLSIAIAASNVVAGAIYYTFQVRHLVKTKQSARAIIGNTNIFLHALRSKPRMSSDATDAFHDTANASKIVYQSSHTIRTSN
jgi:hypothetical protein